MKHGHKKEKIKKNSFLYNIKMSEDKTERNLNKGKFGIKPSFKKKESKGAFHQTLLNICDSDREAYFRYMITQT